MNGYGSSRDAAPQPLLAEKASTLPQLTCVAYALPLLGVGGCVLLFEVYLLKFATDTLYISPATMGIIFSISRLWDAISDPLAGYLCDITKTDFGRRRLWMLCAAPFMGLSFFAAFSPPKSLAATVLAGDAQSGFLLACWMLVAVLFYYTAFTAFKMPSNALGVELSESAAYHERSRLYGYKSLFDGVGSLIGVGMMALLMSRESLGPDRVRSVATACTSSFGLFTALIIAASVALLRESPGRHLQPRANPLSLVPLVLGSPHARLFTGVLVLHDGCKASFGNLAPYALQYVAELPPSMVPAAVAAYLVANVIAVPMWLWAGRRWGKLRAFRASMILNALAFLPMTLVLYRPLVAATTDLQRLALACLCAGLVGFGANARGNLGESIAGDIIDYDHAMSGERKQGVYFAFWMLSQKTAGGCVTLLSGFLLDMAGFVPNREQSFPCKVAITLAFVAMPLVGMASAVWLFSWFGLDEVAHRDVRRTIAEMEEHRIDEQQLSRRRQLLARSHARSHGVPHAQSTDANVDAGKPPALL